MRPGGRITSHPPLMFNRFLWQQMGSSRRPFLFTLGFSLLAGFTIIAQAFLLSRVVDGVFLQEQPAAQAARPLQLLLAVILLRAGLTFGRETAARHIAIPIKSALRQRLTAHLLHLGPTHAAGERTGQLTTLLTEGVETLTAYFSEYLPQLVTAVLIPLAILIAILPADWMTAVILLLTAPLIPLFMVLIGRYAEALTQNQWHTLSRMSAHFLDVIQGLTALKLLGQSEHQAENIRRITGQFRDVTLGVLRVAFLSALALELLATLSVAIVAVAISLRLLDGGLPFADALFVLVLAPEFYLPLRQLGLRFHAGMSGTAAAGQIVDLLARRPQKGGGRRHSGDVIQFQNVSFAYDDGRAALNDISFTLPSGQITALTGPSGAGKSTIAALLMGFLLPDSGTITCPAAIAYVPQRPTLFHDTIAANIRLGRPDAPMSAVITAAKAAGIHPFIAGLPAGYETMVNEGGTRLSGGQAQRLALARALLLDAPFLLLDEPTSQLDTATEANLLMTMHAACAGRTALIIGHRPATRRLAHYLLELADGRLRQSRDNPHPQLPPTSPDWPDVPSAAAPPEPKTPAASPLPRLLRRLAPHKKQVTLAVLLGALTVGSSVSLMATSAFLISAAALQPSIAELSIAIVGVRFFGISRAVFRYLERLASHRVTFRLLAEWRVWFYRAIEPLAPARLQPVRSGDLLARVVADVESLQEFYVRVAAPPLVALVVGGGTAVWLGWFDRGLAGLFGLLWGLAGLALPWLIHRWSQQAGTAVVARRADLHGRLVELVQGMADVLAFGQDGRFRLQITAIERGQAAVQSQLAWVQGAQVGLLEMLTHGGMWLVLWRAVPLAASGQIPAVHLAGLALAAVAAFEAVQPLPQAAHHLTAVLTAARRLFALTDAPPPVPPTGEIVVAPDRPSLSVRGLTFGYIPGAPVLADVSFELPPGKKIAIVGPSGAGKSSLVSALLRFWPLAAGEVLLDGRPLSRFDPAAVRSCFGMVGQQAHLFNASLGDNLRLARPTATDAELLAALAQTALAEFVAELPEGLATAVGDLGKQISGGERRRLALARVILQDPPILLLDEPTANLDEATERVLLQRIFSWVDGRSLIWITHRLVGMDRVDEILVLVNGRVLERGRHADLLADDGFYSRLWRLQNPL